MLALLSLCVALALAAGGPTDWSQCLHTRHEAVDCAKKYADLNGDGVVDRAEIDVLRETSLHWYERLFGWVMKGESTDQLMKKCDANGDGVIDNADFARTQDTCLRDCDSVKDFFHYVCDRQQSMHPDQK